MSVSSPTGPSAAAISIASLIIGALGGFFIGQASSVGVFGRQTRHNRSVNSKAGTGMTHELDGTPGTEPIDDSEWDDEDEDNISVPGELADFADSSEEFKLILVVRTDLGMTKGKIAAQCGHATLANYKTLARMKSPVISRWERRGQAKVAVQVKSEEDLDLLYAQAMSLRLCANVIHDAGRTQIASGSATVLAVGPGPRSIVDKCTGHLKLL